MKKKTEFIKAFGKKLYSLLLSSKILSLDHDDHENNDIDLTKSLLREIVKHHHKSVYMILEKDTLISYNDCDKLTNRDFIDSYFIDPDTIDSTYTKFTLIDSLRDKEEHNIAQLFFNVGYRLFVIDSNMLKKILLFLEILDYLIAVKSRIIDNHSIKNKMIMIKHGEDSQDRYLIEILAGIIINLNLYIFGSRGKIMKDVFKAILIALFYNPDGDYSHILLDSPPGTGKTSLCVHIKELLDLDFSQIQMTPDTLPLDFIAREKFEPKAGTDEWEHKIIFSEIFSNIVLADEINRTPGKTQASILEPMANNNVPFEGRSYKLGIPFVVFDSFKDEDRLRYKNEYLATFYDLQQNSEEFRLFLKGIPPVFFVFATQNPIEQEGTYPLPEAQLDRFLFKINYGNPEESYQQDIIKIKGVIDPILKKLTDLKSKKEIITKLSTDYDIPSEDLAVRWDLFHNINSNKILTYSDIITCRNAINDHITFKPDLLESVHNIRNEINSSEDIEGDLSNRVGILLPLAAKCCAIVESAFNLVYMFEKEKDETNKKKKNGENPGDNGNYNSSSLKEQLNDLIIKHNKKFSDIEVTANDIKFCLQYMIPHRVKLTYEAQAAEKTPEVVISNIINQEIDII